MTPDRWKQIDKLLKASLELPPNKRVASLIEACGDDIELYNEVESLLANEKPSKIFLERDTLHCPDCGKIYPSTERICPEDGHRLSLQDHYRLVGHTIADNKYRIDALIG